MPFSWPNYIFPCLLGEAGRRAAWLNSLFPSGPANSHWKAYYQHRITSVASLEITSTCGQDHQSTSSDVSQGTAASLMLPPPLDHLCFMTDGNFAIAERVYTPNSTSPLCGFRWTARPCPSSIPMKGCMSNLHRSQSRPAREGNLYLQQTYCSLTPFLKAAQALGFLIICDSGSKGPHAQSHFLSPMMVIHRGAGLREPAATSPHSTGLRHGKLEARHLTFQSYTDLF